MKLFHGTSAECAENILVDGFSSDAPRVWSCSDIDNVYLVSQSYDMDYRDDDEIVEVTDYPAFRFAIEAAQITAATFQSKCTDVYVLEFDFPDDALEKEILEEDDSCANMHECYQINADELNSMISTGEVAMTVHKLTEAYEPDLRLFYLPDPENQYWYAPDEKTEKILTRLGNARFNMTDLMCDDYYGTYEEDTHWTYQPDSARKHACMNAA